MLDSAKGYLKARKQFFPRTSDLSLSDLARVAMTWYLLNVEPWVGIPGIDGDQVEWKKPEFANGKER